MRNDLETLLVTRQEGVVTVTLNRPEKKNAINAVMWDELASVLREIHASADDRALVLTGAGPTFSSGADLSPAGGPHVHPLFQMDRVQSVVLALHELHKPTVACVDGDAIVAGWNLALACDVVVATTRSRFSAIFVRRGLSVDLGGSWLLPRLIGLHRAKLLCLTGEFITAADAATLGLVTNLVEPIELEERVGDLARRLASGPPVAQALIKRLLNESSNRNLAEALSAESAAQAVAMSTRDVREGLAAFIEKREPSFIGR